MKSCFSLVLALALAVPAMATTWYVETDGSTGFSTIQSAIDVAASGDTIRIGPGIYNQLHYLPPPLEEERAIVHIPLQDLTLIGSGRDATFVGFGRSWEAAWGYMRGIHSGHALGNQSLRIEDLCVRNVYDGLFSQEGGQLHVVNCRFYGSNTDAALYTPNPQPGDSMEFVDCIFEPSDIVSSSDHIWAHRQDLLIVRNCQFRLEDLGADSHVLFSGRQAIIEGCEFYEGRVGISVGIVCDEIQVRDCLFDGQGYFGITSETGVNSVEDCHFRNQFVAFLENDYHGNVNWSVQRVTVENVSDSTFRFKSLGTGFISDSILAKGPTYVVRAYNIEKSARGISYFDMTNNWWGTTESDSIQAWIYDGVDNPEIGGIIDYRGFKTEPLATERTSLGGLKALFKASE